MSRSLPIAQYEGCHTTCNCRDCLYDQIMMGPTRPPPVHTMTIAAAVRIAGTLGHPSKMPGWSYGLDAWECKRGTALRTVPGSICSGCFAMGGWYQFRNIARGQTRRQNGVHHPKWVEAMVRLIDRYCTKPAAYFRWHDSGDLQGVWHLRNIVKVAMRTPWVKYWLPTHEPEIVREFVANNELPDNLTIRISADMLDEQPPDVNGLPTSTVHRYSIRPVMVSERRADSLRCRSIERGHICGPCRACWSSKVKNVSYLFHQ